MREYWAYLVSPDELRFLERTLQRRPRAPKSEAKTTADPGAKPGEIDNGLKSSLRLTTRILAGGTTALAITGALRTRLMKTPQNKVVGNRISSINLPLTASAILLLHRIIYRAFLRLTRTVSSVQTRRLSHVQKKLYSLLSSAASPSIAAAFAGTALAIIPPGDTRLTISIYVCARALEYLSNALHISDHTPWWFGSWLLFPVSTAQLFHALLTDTGTVPFTYRTALMRFPTANPNKQIGASAHDIAAQTKALSDLNFPKFHSPVVYPKSLSTKHKDLSSATRNAHPAIEQFSCAIVHPRTTSCLKTYASFLVHHFGKNTGLLLAFYSALSIPKSRDSRQSVISLLSKLIPKALRTSAFITLAVGSSWSALCYLQKILPQKSMKKYIFYLSGLIGGLMAFGDRESSHPLFLDAARNSAISWGKVYNKSNRRHRVPSVDIMIFMASIATLNILYDANPTAITSKAVRRMIGVLREPVFADEPLHEGNASDGHSSKNA